MSDIVVLCPTRERPDKAAEMVASLRDTASLFATEVVLVVDDDDPCVADYRALPAHFAQRSSGPLWPPNALRIMVIPAQEGGSLTAATNTAAARVWHDDIIIGHVGDDHRFETVGWDQRIVSVLSAPGVAFGDDGHWHERLPTAVFMSSIIPRLLGWYALPLCRHYGIDNAWRDIGEGIGALHYLPEVMIRQPREPAVPDPVYLRSQEYRKADQFTYYAWRDKGGRVADLERLQAAMAVAA